jgi:hypothetical protein
MTKQQAGPARMAPRIHSHMSKTFSRIDAASGNNGFLGK